MQERPAVSSDNGGMRAFGERKLPRVIFAKTSALPLCGALQLRAFCGMLKTDILGNIAADEFHALRRIGASFQKLGSGNAAHNERPLAPLPVLVKPFHGRAGDTCFDLAFEVDQER